MRVFVSLIVGLCSGCFGVAGAFVLTALYAKSFPGTLAVSQDPYSHGIGLMLLFSVLALTLGLGGFGLGFVAVWRNYASKVIEQ